MAPKKKNPVTGYSIFVRETRIQYERAKRQFPKNNQDAFIFVGPLWKKLSDEEKKRYNDMAKLEKKLGASDAESKFNSSGMTFAEIDAEQRERIENKNIMMNTIHNTVHNADINTAFLNQKFYICHVNFFYSNNSNRFKPAEIAFSEFNLKKGVIDTLHSFINPGPIETGYRFEAMKKAEDTHQIPIEDPKWSLGERDYVRLYNKIKNFLTRDNPGGRIPPIYTMPDDEKNNTSISAVKSTLETLCEACNEELSEFRIYELPLLYHEMRVKTMSESTIKPDPVTASFLSLSSALHDLDKDKFCFTKGISCPYHEEKDIVIFCSLSVVTRLVYTMCDYLLNFVPVDLIGGGHVPKNSVKASQIYRSNIKQEEQDDDGFTMVPLRRPYIKPAAEMSNNPSGAARPQKYNQVASSHLQEKAVPKVTTPENLKIENLSISKPTIHQQRGVYDDSDDSSHDDEPETNSTVTMNLTQNTVISGYTASASLSQSSYCSEVSADALPYIGRGRGLPRSQPAPETVNWALSAGRGARLRRKL